MESREKFIINFVAFSLFPSIFWCCIILGYEIGFISYELIEVILSKQMRDSFISTSPFGYLVFFIIWSAVGSLIVWKYKHIKSVKLSLFSGFTVVVLILARVYFLH